MDGLDKHEIEQFTCDQFLLRYSKITYDQVGIEKSEAPDFIVKDNSKKILFGLEISQAIFESEGGLEARKLHHRSDTIVDMADEDRERKFKSNMGPITDTIKNNTSEIPNVYRRAIEKKQNIDYRIENKQDTDYRTDIPLILCIRWTHPIFEKLGEYVREIKTPPNTLFNEIWAIGFQLPNLVLKVNGTDNCYGIYQIHPDN